MSLRMRGFDHITTSSLKSLTSLFEFSASSDGKDDDDRRVPGQHKPFHQFYASKLKSN